MRNCIGCIGVIELAQAITLRKMSDYQAQV